MSSAPRKESVHVNGSLEGLHIQYKKVHSEMEDEIEKIDRRAWSSYTQSLTKRGVIVKGNAQQLEGNDDEDVNEEQVQGVPGFWLKALENHPLLGEIIQDCDEEVLMELQDINVTVLADNKHGFRLDFHFNPSCPYFSNKVLSKTYPFKLVNGSRVFEQALGTPIQWKKDMDYTVKKVAKKVKKGKGKGEVVKEKIHKVSSFMHFFNPPKKAYDEDEDEEGDSNTRKEKAILKRVHAIQEDLEVGAAFKNELVPHAYVWFMDTDCRGESRDLNDPSQNMSVETLPVVMQERLRVIHEQQKVQLDLERDVKAKMASVRRTYEVQFHTVFEKRQKVITAHLENDPESDISLFWMRALANNEVASQLLKRRDLDALAYVRDIRFENLKGRNGFSTVFTFGNNPYFTNKTLTKTFVVEENGQPSSEEGTEIDWQGDSDLTKRSYSGESGSFFSGPRGMFSLFATGEGECIFDEPGVPMATNAMLSRHLICEALKNEVIPNAYEFYSKEPMLDELDNDSDLERLHEELDAEDEEEEAAAVDLGDKLSKIKKRHNKKKVEKEEGGSSSNWKIYFLGGLMLASQLIWLVSALGIPLMPEGNSEGGANKLYDEGEQ